MIIYHPHQNVYFNFLAGKNPGKNFELDYWGTSNKQALEYILNNSDSYQIKVGAAGPISLENSKKIFNLEDQNRIIVSNNSEADFIIDNYIDWNGVYKRKRHIIPTNFNIIKEIIIDKKIIVSIYKKM